MDTLGKVASTHGMCDTEVTIADSVASGSGLQAQACEVPHKEGGGLCRRTTGQGCSHLSPSGKGAVSALPRPERVGMTKSEQEAEQK